MKIFGIEVDTTRGFDVFRGKRLLKHFDSYEEAVAHAAKKPGRYIRYWELKQ